MESAGVPSYEAYSSSGSGASYTNPFGNTTVVDTVPEDMLHLIDAHWYQFPPMNPMWYNLVCFFNVVTGIISIVGNSTVIYVFLTTKNLRSPSNYYVVSLAVSDFTMMFCMMPPLVVNSYYQTWVFGPTYCAIYGAIGAMVGCVSIYTMVLITSDRYNVIVMGMSGTPLTTTRAMINIAISWLMASIWTFAPLLGWGRYVPEGNMTACGTDYFSMDINNLSYVHVFALYTYFIPLLYIIFAYTHIVKAVADHEKQMREQAKKMGVKSLRSDKEANQKSNDCKLAKIALMTVSLWFMAWTPYCVINLAGFWKPSMVSPLFSIWGSVFAKANTIYNPIIYAISHPKYKAALYKKMPFLACNGDSGDDESKSATSVSTTADEKA